MRNFLLVCFSFFFSAQLAASECRYLDVNSYLQDGANSSDEGARRHPALSPVFTVSLNANGNYEYKVCHLPRGAFQSIDEIAKSPLVGCEPFGPLLWVPPKKVQDFVATKLYQPLDVRVDIVKWWFRTGFLTGGLALITVLHKFKFAMLPLAEKWLEPGVNYFLIAASAGSTGLGVREIWSPYLLNGQAFTFINLQPNPINPESITVSDSRGPIDREHLLVALGSLASWSGQSNHSNSSNMTRFVRRR